MWFRKLIAFLLFALPACSIPEGKGIVAGEMFI
jgi:hypothetical protein